MGPENLEVTKPEVNIPADSHSLGPICDQLSNYRLNYPASSFLITSSDVSKNGRLDFLELNYRYLNLEVTGFIAIRERFYHPGFGKTRVGFGPWHYEWIEVYDLITKMFRYAREKPFTFKRKRHAARVRGGELRFYRKLWFLGP